MKNDRSHRGDGAQTELDLIRQEKGMLTEYRKGIDVVPIEFKPETRRFIVPASLNRAIRTIILKDNSCHEKRLVFSALYTAYYLAFVCNSDNALRSLVSDIFPRFVEYLNQLDITSNNKGNILKGFETFRVKNDQVKTQSTGLRELITALNKALSYIPFGIEYLSNDEYRYLDQLSKTKLAAKDESEQNTLTEWFGFHSWLRLDEVGVGSELFNRVVSPKLLTNSLQITCATALIELHNAKHSLINLFIVKAVKRNYFPMPPSYPDASLYANGSVDSQYIKDIAQYKKNTLNYKRTFFERLAEILSCTSDERAFSIRVAIDALIYSQCTKNVIAYVRDRIEKNGNINQQTTLQGKIETVFKQQTPQCLLFTIEFILELVDYVGAKAKSVIVPTCKAENYLFSVLMAYQTVAVTDIYRLRRSNFKFLKKQNGKVTHIDCAYFKSRANSVHSTNMINANSQLGNAILAFINDRTAEMSQDCGALVCDTGITKLKTGAFSSASTLFRFLSYSTVRLKIDNEIKRSNSSPVFLDTLNRVLDHGVKKEAFNRQSKSGHDDWLMECQTPCKGRLFGLENIKNSSVHAASDDFDASRLMNYRSHTMETERHHYLNKENEVWLNNCGRITRAVMHDLQCNVFRPSKGDKVLFQSDFTKALRYVEQRKSDVLSRLKIITEKKNGRVDELGFSKADGHIEGELPDSLYLVESPETVMKLRHYLDELHRTHEQLAKCNPDFLFYTALPTAEWIETVFSIRLFNRETVNQGEVMYKKYKEHLPQLFFAQTGGNSVGN